MFPKLGAKQIDRLEAHGQHVELRAGEILAQPGDRHLPLLVVLSGSIEVVQVGWLARTRRASRGRQL